MTLITRIHCSDFSIISGEGCTVTDDNKYDEKLRKVYINSDYSVAFAGENWISNELKEKGIYVANMIESFLNTNSEFDSCLAYSHQLINTLIEENQHLDTELFISSRNGNILNNLYAKTKNQEFELKNYDNNEFHLEFSRLPKAQMRWINKFFYELWHDFFETPNDGQLKINKELHKLDNICRFIDYFYRQVCRFSHFNRSFVIGESVDISVITKQNIRFYKKENLTISEQMQENR